MIVAASCYSTGSDEREACFSGSLVKKKLCVMAVGTKLLVCAALFSWFIGGGESACPVGWIHCRTSEDCIKLSDVCRNGDQCNDGSDEAEHICMKWTYDATRCGPGLFHCSKDPVSECKTVEGFCSQPACKDEKDVTLCEMVEIGRLAPAFDEFAIKLSEDMVKYLEQAANVSFPGAGFSCPMLYSRLGDECVSFFSIARVPWAEAREFCLSIRGDLLTFDDTKIKYQELLEYMQASQLTTDYWIGGRFDLDNNEWSWVDNDKPMPLGAPYWATRYSSTCVPRPPLSQIDLDHELPEGAPCYHYVQAPSKRAKGYCAAMTYEHYYYITDESCQESRSPMCIFIQ